MKKIIITISFCLMALNLLAQVSDGAQIVTTSQRSPDPEDIKVLTINGNSATIQLQVGVIFQRGIVDQNNTNPTYNAIFRFPWDILYIYDTFSEENASFDISKGFFGDKVLISWELKNNYDDIKLLKIYRRKYTDDNSENWIFQSNVSKDENSYEDLYVDGGVLYEYKVEADGLDGNDYLQKYITGIGFRSPTAIVTGNVSFDGGSGVPGVTVSATTNTNNESSGNSLLINYNSFIDIKRINKPIDKVATLQTWVKPFERPNNPAPIRLFNLNDTNKNIDITVRVDQPNFGGLVFEVGNSQFILRNFFPTGNTNNRGDDIMLPIDSFFDVFTHFSVVLNDNEKPKLFINGREINQTYIEKIQELEITENDKKINPYKDINFQIFNKIIDLSTTHEGSWNDIKIGGTTKAIFDEIRIWNSELSENEIRTDFKRYISGNDKRLISYLGINEGLGIHIYDNSRDGFNYNKNHAEFRTIGIYNKHEITWLEGVNNTASTSKINNDVSGPYQLGVLGVTDENGNYEISAIPYSGTGESFKITPSIGLHQFEPGQKLVYLGQGSTVVNDVNFIDKSSFQFKGQVLYDSRGVFQPFADPVASGAGITEDGYNAYQDLNGVPYAKGQHWLNPGEDLNSKTDDTLEEYAKITIEGANIYIDGEIVLDSNNFPVITDTEGKFTINVPIGNHYITVKKNGHEFEFDGRYPKTSSDPKDNFEEFFENREDIVTFVDKTRVTVVGRIVGGAVQAEKEIGFGLDATLDEDNNEIGGVFKKTYIDTEGKEVDEIISSINNIGQAKVVFNYPDHDKVQPETQFTFKTNKETGEFRIAILPIIYKYKKEDITIITQPSLPIGSTSAIELDFSKIPDKITPTYESENIEKTEGNPYHYKQSFNYRATPVLNVINQESENNVTINGESFSTDGFAYPIYDQKNKEGYSIYLQTFEKYTNYDNTIPTDDIVPVIDGELVINNELALEGTERLTSDKNSSFSKYSFNAGVPSFAANSEFLKPISLKFKLDGEFYNPVGDFKNKGIIIGGASDGTKTFTTNAPDIPDIILRDPPGSNSFASIEKGQSISFNTSASFADSEGGSETLEFDFGVEMNISKGVAPGPIDKIEVEDGLDLSTSLNYKSTNGNSVTKTYTFNQTISTSDDPDWVGADADLYIGNSVNLFYSSFNKLTLTKAIVGDVANNVELTNSFGEKVYLNLKSDFAMSPDPSDTFFVYSQRYILNDLIPQYISFIAAINAVDSEITEGEDGWLTVDEYKQQIRLWREIILKNELDKFIAVTPSLKAKKKEILKYITNTFNKDLKDIIDSSDDPLGEINLNSKLDNSKKIAELLDQYYEENVSFDAGVGEITRSIETTTILDNNVEYNITIDESVAARIGKSFNKFGLNTNTSGFFQQDINTTLSEEEQKTTIFSYTIKDNDKANLLSLDIINVFGDFGPIFITQGGRTSCPYEGGEVSKLLTKQKFKNYFSVIHPAQSSLENKKAEFKRINYKINHTLYSDQEEYNTDKANLDLIDKEIKIFQKVIKDNYKSLVENFESLDNLESTDNAVLSFGTQRVEVPLLEVLDADVVNIPEDKNGEYTLRLGNNSASGSDATFVLKVDNNTTNNEITTNIEANGTIVNVPYGKTVDFLLTIGKLRSDKYDYQGIRVILESLCDGEDVSADVIVNASFVPTCTDVVVDLPADNWVYNRSTAFNSDGTTKPLNINLNSFNASFNSFQKIELQYRLATSPNWNLLQTYYASQTLYDEAIVNGLIASQISLINSSDLLFPFNIADKNLSNGEYEIRAISYCTGGGPDGTQTISEIIKGTVDLNAPEKFGTPLPIDGILGVGEDLRVRFNENITYNPSISKIEILGVTNQEPIDNSVSLYFNGINNNVTIEKPRIVNGDFSLEFWMLNQTTASSATIFNQEDGLNISIQNGNLTATIGSNTISEVINNDNSFHHYTISYESETGTLYLYEDSTVLKLINGEANTSFTNNKTLKIGGSNFIGNIHDLRIWSKFISIDDAIANLSTKYIGNESDLLGYYPMNEGRGELANDLAFFKHGIVNTNWDIKPKGTSYEFSNRQYLELDQLSKVILTENMDATISFWLKTGASQDATIFSNGRGNDTDPKNTNGFSEKWAININNNGLLSFESEEQSYPITSESIVDNKWHHIALVLNRKGALNTFIDAEQVSSNAVNEINGFSETKAWLGARGHKDAVGLETIDRVFSGKIDEFRLWNSARTIEQISRDRFNEVDNQSLGLMLYLRFNEPKPSTGNGPRYWHTSTGNDNIPNNSIFNTGDANYSDDVPAIKPARKLTKFGVNHVINGDELIIEPAVSDWAVLEGQVLDITVHRMFDSAYNRQESPITWTAYVQKNEVDWFVEDHIHVVDIIKYKDEDKTFEITLVNNGGTTEQFSILNSPNWLHLDVSSGIISPDSKRIITATIDKELGANVYNEILYLETDFGHNQTLPLNLRVLEQEPDWAVNPNNFTSSSNIIGRIKVDGIFSADQYDRIGVFYNDEVRGVANLQYDDSYKQYYVYLTIYSNAGKVDDTDGSETENLTFKIWDASQGKVLESTIDNILTIPYQLNDVMGNLVNPKLFENTSSIEQEISFNEGWTWVSFNVNDDNFINLNELTKNMALATNDRMVSTAPVKSETYTENFGWDGTISNSGGISADNMYKIYLSNEQSLKIKGSIVNINNWSFPIVKDWNWLPFTLPSNVLLNDALASYQATTNDVIKSQNLFAIYDQNNGWIGSLHYLEDGKGYMLESAIEQNFNYPISYAKTSLKGNSQENISQEFSKYSNSMNAIVLLPKEYDELLVLNSKNEIRGQSKTKLYGGKLLSFITIYGEEIDDLEFYLKNDKTLKPSSKKFSFNRNTLLGTFKEPIDLREHKFNFSVSPNPFKNELSIKVNADKDETSRIILFSITGQQVFEKEFKINKGNNSLTVNPGISNGVYLLHYISNNETIIKKIIKD